MGARRRGAVLALLAASALAGCATERRDIVVNVRITGDLQRSGTYVGRDGENRGGIATGCGRLHALPAPMPDGRMPYVPPLWQVLISARDRPPADVFEFRAYDEGREADDVVLRHPRLRFTAAGRVWESGEGDDVIVAADAGFRSGRFRAVGVRPEDGGPERITIEGEWRCPGVPSRPWRSREPPRRDRHAPTGVSDVIPHNRKLVS